MSTNTSHPPLAPAAAAVAAVDIEQTNQLELGLESITPNRMNIIEHHLTSDILDDRCRNIIEHEVIRTDSSSGSSNSGSMNEWEEVSSMESQQQQQQQLTPPFTDAGAGAGSTTAAAVNTDVTNKNSTSILTPSVAADVTSSNIYTFIPSDNRCHMLDDVTSDLNRLDDQMKDLKRWTETVTTAIPSTTATISHQIDQPQSNILHQTSDILDDRCKMLNDQPPLTNLYAGLGVTNAFWMTAPAPPLAPPPSVSVEEKKTELIVPHQQLRVGIRVIADEYTNQLPTTRMLAVLKSTDVTTVEKLDWLKSHIDSIQFHVNHQLEAEAIEAFMKLGLEIKAAAPVSAPAAAQSELSDPTLVANFGSSLKVDDLCDCFDIARNWCVAKVIQRKNHGVKVTFVDWSSNWDTWFDYESKALQPYRSKTKGYTGPASKKPPSPTSASSVFHAQSSSIAASKPKSAVVFVANTPKQQFLSILDKIVQKLSSKKISVEGQEVLMNHIFSAASLKLDLEFDGWMHRLLKAIVQDDLTTKDVTVGAFRLFNLQRFDLICDLLTRTGSMKLYGAVINPFRIGVASCPQYNFITWIQFIHPTQLIVQLEEVKAILNDIRTMVMTRIIPKVREHAPNFGLGLGENELCALTLDFIDCFGQPTNKFDQLFTSELMNESTMGVIKV